MATEPNDPAFSELEIRDGIVRHFGGLSKREYFAAMAMQGLARYAEGVNEEKVGVILAILAVRFADALIAELNQPAPMTEAEKKGLAY